LFLTVGMLLFYLLSYAVYASDDRIPIIVWFMLCKSPDPNLDPKMEIRKI
jgi:hypothetical protein